MAGWPWYPSGKPFPTMLNVFISSTTRDLEQYRAEARTWVQTARLNDIAMERWGARPDPPEKVVREALEESHLFVGIVAWRYGSIVDGKKVSYIHFEHELARKRGMPRLIFLADEEGEWPVKQIDRDARQIWDFRSTIEKGITRKSFKDIEEFRQGLADSLFQTVRSTRSFDKLSPEGKATMQIADLIQGDLTLRDSRDEGAKAARQWFISAVPRCNLGRRYIEREDTSGRFGDWLLRRPTPYFVVTGPSGVGKTNFILAQLEHIIRKPAPKSVQSQRVALYLPLGCYFKPGERLCDTFGRYFAKHGGNTESIRPETFSTLIRSGDAVLILDGLDEMVRNRGEEACGKLLAALNEEVDMDYSLVVLACRDHIYSRLQSRGFVPAKATVEEVEELEGEALEVAIADRFDARARHVMDEVPALKRFARSPLLLQMMTRMDPGSWDRLAKEPRRARLYELWTDEMILHCAGNEGFLSRDQLAVMTTKLGRIATLMLANRSDVVDASLLKAEGLPMDKLKSANRESLSILVRQTKREWGFVHDSFREYALARLVADDLNSSRHTHLSSLKDLDYVSSETYCFLAEMFASREELLKRLEAAIQTPLRDKARRNNLLRNCFEAIGVVGERSAERFILLALEMLAPKNRSRLFSRTQHNIVRCLERLHRSAPQPYYDDVMRQNWPDEPTADYFGAAAVRGFHQAKRTIGYSHPMVHRGGRNEGRNPYQKQVSDCLISLIRSASPKTQDGMELIANCTFALIRWLHPTHVKVLKALTRAGQIAARAKGNVFLALLKFENHGLFTGETDLFAGMELSWVAISRRHVSDDFKFDSVTFHRCRKYLDFSEDRFINCSFV